jgi:hypothetical protein
LLEIRIKMERKGMRDEMKAHLSPDQSLGTLRVAGKSKNGVTLAFILASTRSGDILTNRHRATGPNAPAMLFKVLENLVPLGPVA